FSIDSALYNQGINDIDILHKILDLTATLSMCHQSEKYWRELFRSATNLRNIGGNFSDVPPI
ncbi:hypothetical protein, partial [Tetragenococcus halophilus]|uniref:hypothetical protein n=1 Tax=Tetragenococcus halophilus TaxID=51669 RepID=UPI00295E34C0